MQEKKDSGPEGNRRGRIHEAEDRVVTSDMALFAIFEI